MLPPKLPKLCWNRH